jgi:integrase
LQPIAVTKIHHGPPRVPWNELPISFRADVDAYLEWASVPDPLDEDARGTALKKGTLALRKDHIHSAVSAAIAAGLSIGDLVSFSSLVERDTLKKILRYRWEAEGRLLARLIKLPDKLWRQRASDLKTSRLGFIELQSALAIEILLVAPLRMGNLSALCFDKHIRWPHGYERPAWIIIDESETKNGIALEFELPQSLSDRLATYRSEIVPNIPGARAIHLFVGWTGKRRLQAAVALGIEKTVLKYVGVRLTPHQFRHLAAKLLLDGSPDAYPLVQQLMGHKNMQTTINFYAGIDTRRAGRAHAELISRLKRDL